MSHFYDCIHSVEDLSRLSAASLVMLLADVFRGYGYAVDVPTWPEDYSTDFVMTKSDSRVLVQARRHTDAAGGDSVRDAQLARRYFGADEAWVVCALGFTESAISAAEEADVHLVTGEGVLRLIEALVEPAADARRLAMSGVEDEHLAPAIPDELIFTVSGDLYKRLDQYHGRERDVVIPADLGIAWIGPYAFSDPGDHRDLIEGFTQPVCDWKHLRSVVIPEGVEWISFDAFNGCSALESVTLPSTLKRIWSDAFKGCASLREVELPESLQEIGISAFEGCASLRAIRIPTGLEKIGLCAFEGCDSLSELELRPQGKLEIGARAFKGSGITRLTMSGNVTLEEGCFQGCKQLESVEILDVPNDDAQTDALSARVGLEVLPASTFEQCTSLDSVELPSTLASVGEKAFAGCERLFSIELPDAVREIGVGAFEGCSLLWSIDLPEGIETIRPGTFASCQSLSRVSLSDGLKTIEERAFSTCKMLGRVELPSSIEEVVPRAFEDCERLSEVTLVGEGCCGTFYRSSFAGCPALDRPAPINNLPDSATLVDDAAFTGMFDGPAHELRALKFDTYRYGDPPRYSWGFLVVDRGVPGLNSLSGEAVDDEGVRFWVELDDGYECGYYAVRSAGQGSESESIVEGYLEPKGDGQGTSDPSRRELGPIKTGFSVYLSGCHLIPSPGIDSAKAARVEEEYRRRVTPLVDEFWKVNGDKSDRGKLSKRDKLAALDGLHDKIRSANVQFVAQAKEVGLDHGYYVSRYGGSIGNRLAPSAQVVRAKEAKRLAKARVRSQSSGELMGCLAEGCLKGCYFLIIATFAVMMLIGYLMILLV